MRIVDISGLAEPIAARADPIPGRHRRASQADRVAWYDARFGAGPTTRRGRRAVPSTAHRSPTSSMRSRPLTLGRFLSNIWHSLDHTRLPIPVDPRRAVALLCRSP